jgi:hypothetical protein
MFKHAVLILAATVATTFGAPKVLFEVQLQDVPSGGLVCQITFFGVPPAPATVDKIVRDTLQSAALVEPTRDILGMAFRGDDTLNSNQYSGALIYRAADKRIVTLEESRGVKTTAADAGAYYVELKEDGTLAGIKPERKWLSLSIVFPTQPTAQQAIDASVSEIQKHATRGLDINAAPKIGDKNVKTSWQQMRDPNGGFFYFRYTAADRTIYNKSAPLKKLP